MFIISANLPPQLTNPIFFLYDPDDFFSQNNILTLILLAFMMQKSVVLHRDVEVLGYEVHC